MRKRIRYLWMNAVVKKYFFAGVLSVLTFSSMTFFPLTSYAAPASGTKYLLVIGVDYADRAATYSASQVQPLAFGTSSSIAQYYNNVSYSAVTISPATESYGTSTDGFIGWLRLSGSHPNPGQYTDPTTWRAIQQQIAKNAILAADTYINYASYDTNGDGTVSSTELAILVIVAGYQASIGNTQPSVYAEAANMSTVGYPSVDGKTLEKYALVGEIHKFSGSPDENLATFGVMTHELGHHMFSLPDLMGSGTARGIGRFDLMANGDWGAASGAQQGSSPTHLSAWCKEYLSWGTVTTISSNQTVSFPKVDGNSASLFRINTSDPNQYFLIENRQFSGYDIGFQVDTGTSSHGGLVIYHIDTTKTNLYPGTSNVNEDVNDKGVDVEEANQGSYGSSMLDTGVAEAHMNMFFFSGNNTSFTNSTTPNSKLKIGNATNISITDISAYGDTMTATVVVPPIVSSTSPASGTTSVAVNTAITATFNRAMDSSTINTSTFTLSGGVTGTVSYDSSTKTATFTPSSNLSYSTTYTATITSDVKDSEGNNMGYYTWSFTTSPLFNITTVSSGGIGGYTSLTLDSSEKAHISCYDWTNGDLKYATNSSGTWTTTTVDSSGNIGEYTAIALDSSGKAYISYYDRTNNYLKYATNASGSWVKTPVDSSGNVAGYTSIALDSSGNSSISYFDSTGFLKYATNSSGTWATGLADTNGGVGGYTSLALDSSGKAHISYYDWGNGDLKYTTNATGSWVATTVDSAGDRGTSTSIALDSSEKVHISYYDGTNGNFMYATNASGSWGTTTVDSTGDVGQYTSLALDSSGKAHISYYDSTNGNLIYATNATGSWGTTTVDSSGDVGKYTSIKLDSSGKVHISYFDSTNGALKYAVNDTIPPAINSTSPAGSATGVAVNTAITATFNDAMDPLTISASTFTVSSGGSAVSGTVSYNNSTKTATFTPSSTLSYSTTYTVTITTSAKDSAGNSLASAYTWNFTTASAPASEPPQSKATLTVTSTSPSSGATGVGTNTAVTASFSDNMNGSTLTTDTFQLSGGGSNVSGSVSTNGNKATFTPSAALAYNTTYTATITTGAQAANAAGTALESNYTWSFTTSSAPVAATTSPTPAAISTPTSIPVTTPSPTPAPTATPSQPGSLRLSKEVAYLSGDTIGVTVVDTDRNTNITSEDTLTTAIKVTPLNYHAESDLLLDLKEDSVNSGTFLATIRTGTTTTGGAGLSARSNIGTIKTTQGGTATVMYTDTIPNASTITKTVSFSSSDATLEFDAESYTIGSYVVLIHADAEENKDYTKAETLLDHAFIETSPFNRTKVKFVETGLDTGTFRGSIRIAALPSLEYERIQASAGEILTAWCEDKINTTNAPRVVKDNCKVADADVTPVPSPTAFPTPDVTPQFTPVLPPTPVITPTLPPQQTPTVTPAASPSPAVCIAESVTSSPSNLKLRKKQSEEVTITVTGEGGCPVEGETVTAKISLGNKLISISPSAQETDENGQAVFTINSRKKAGVARVIFSEGSVKKSLTVNVKK